MSTGTVTYVLVRVLALEPTGCDRSHSTSAVLGEHGIHGIIRIPALCCSVEDVKGLSPATHELRARSRRTQKQTRICQQ